MPDALIARRPIGRREDEPLRAHGSFATARLGERPLQPAYELQFDTDDNATAEALIGASGLELTASNRAVAAGETIALWLGPGRWLINNASPAIAALEHAVAATRSSLIDVSDLWCSVSVAGKRSRDVLAKGCALDLDPHVFTPGTTAVTQFVRMYALIHCVDDTPTYHVYVERSFAAYLWAWLADAMTEFFD